MSHTTADTTAVPCPPMVPPVCSRSSPMAQSVFSRSPDGPACHRRTCRSVPSPLDGLVHRCGSDGAVSLFFSSFFFSSGGLSWGASGRSSGSTGGCRTSTTRSSTTCSRRCRSSTTRSSRPGSRLSSRSTTCGNCDIIFGPFSARISQLHPTPHALWAARYLVPMLASC